MTDRLNRIYDQLWPEPSETELYITERWEECALLERQLLKVAENLPPETGELIKRYVYSREELELYSVTQAYKAGQKAGRQTEHYYK